MLTNLIKITKQKNPFPPLRTLNPKKPLTFLGNHKRGKNPQKILLQTKQEK